MANEPAEKPDVTPDDIKILDSIWDRIGQGRPVTPLSKPLRRVAERLVLNLEPGKSKD